MMKNITNYENYFSKKVEWWNILQIYVSVDGEKEVVWLPYPLYRELNLSPSD